MKLDHIAINVKDITVSKEWYANNLGATVDYEDDTWAMLDCSGTKIALTISKQHPPHIGFTCTTLSELPGMPKYHRDGSAYVYTKDPDDNVVEYVYWPSKD
mgnify:FL=1|tara:strand:+ start:12794 stop:13096 length:303 start_codon:yes stop_codon:yes gene_type:complete